MLEYPRVSGSSRVAPNACPAESNAMTISGRVIKLITRKLVITNRMLALPVITVSALCQWIYSRHGCVERAFIANVAGS